MQLDNIDIQNLNEMYDKDFINKFDINNINTIYNYLIDKGIYYAKDIFVENFELFLLDSNNFINKFDKLIEKLGPNYIEIIGEDSSVLEELYK